MHAETASGTLGAGATAPASTPGQPAADDAARRHALAEAWLAGATAPASTAAHDDARLFATLIAAREADGRLAQLGLAPKQLRALLTRHVGVGRGDDGERFDDAGFEVGRDGGRPSHAGVGANAVAFAGTLRTLLLARADPSVDADDAACLAAIIAQACLRPDHLWRDLGLSGREDVTRMLARFFPGVHAGNVDNLRWKKFLAVLVARENGSEPAPAPGCPGCEDYRVCFPPASR